MKISKHTTFGQFYVLPYIAITHDPTLNGEYELIFGWLGVGISLSFKPKERCPIVGKQYKVDIESIKTIEDVKCIFKFMDLHFTPQNKEDYESIKHILKEVPY